jgi:hypothetical protein
MVLSLNLNVPKTNSLFFLHCHFMILITYSLLDFIFLKTASVFCMLFFQAEMGTFVKLSTLRKLDTELHQMKQFEVHSRTKLAVNRGKCFSVSGYNHLAMEITQEIFCVL